MVVAAIPRFFAISPIDRALLRRANVASSVGMRTTFCFGPIPGFPPQARMKFECIVASSFGSMVLNFSRAFADCIRNASSRARTSGCTSSARWFKPASESPASVRTRESATYPWPYSKVCERSMWTASSDIPWLLCTVIAHARRRGTWMMRARTRPPSSMRHSSGSAYSVLLAFVFKLACVLSVNVGSVAVELCYIFFPPRRVARAQERALFLRRLASPNRRKKVQKHRIFLTMLFGEIAYEWVECLPCGRQKGEPFLLRISRERFLLWPAEALSEGGRVLVFIPPVNRRQLKKVADKNDLQSAKRLPGPPQFATHCVDHCERLRGKHGYFVDDEDASIADAPDDISVLPDSVKIVVCEIAPHPNPAP